MESSLLIDPLVRQEIEGGAHAAINLCWTCQSCTTECPVNLATNRLNPMKIVRMANFGLIDELISDPSIWYCQSCNRCIQVCPMTVKPVHVINYIRELILQKNLISRDTYQQFNDLLRRFHRVRRYGILTCLKKEKLSLSAEKFNELLNTPITPEEESVLMDFSSELSPSLLKTLNDADTFSCFTCSACSSSCPVFLERPLFEPQSVFRMANLGLTDKLLSSTWIWLCIGCQRCTDNCSQLVKGHATIESLRALAVKEDFVPVSFASQLKEMEKVIYPYLLDEIDKLLGLPLKDTAQKQN
ncbi:MAG: 4Fe-4S dicluster domain-containing protein [Deltaproteobacteria bacterium]|nr:4Fe-4S dicluster domain-containing protein [Deltaproteobacteria bacterium]